MRIPGRVDDTISHREGQKEMCGISQPYWQNHHLVDHEVRKDPALRKNFNNLEKDPNSH